MWWRKKRILSSFCLVLPPEKPFTVEISPGPQIVAQIGDSVVLTCGVTDCETPSFTWRTQIDSPLSGTVKTEGSKSTLTLSPVSFENEHSYLCTVTCGHKKVEKGIKVDLYCKWISVLFAGFFFSPSQFYWKKQNASLWYTMRSMCLERELNIVNCS